MQFAVRQSVSHFSRVASLTIALLLLIVLLLPGCTMGWREESAGSEQSAAIATLTLSPDEPRAESFETAEPGVQITLTDRVEAASAATVIATAPAGSSIAESASQGWQHITHTIKPGDTLTRISERYNVSINALLNANDLPNPDFLTVGQVIKLPQTPVDYTPPDRVLPDSRMVRSIGAARFDIERFVRSQPGALRELTLMTPTRLADGAQRHDLLSGSQVVERVSREYSVDARILLAFLEQFANLVTNPEVDDETQLYPFLAPAPASGAVREGLYNQLSWLANQLNEGYYGWKYRGNTILEDAAGSRLSIHADLNAGSVAVQFAIAQIRGIDQWEADVGEAGFAATYRRLFGDPFIEEHETVPTNLHQPDLTLPFPRGDVWRFTGGFHGGWGNGSAWSAVDFAPPDEEGAGWCYTSRYPITAIARGLIARMGDGLIVLDLDEDGDEGSGWTILYLHVSAHDALREGQVVNAGNILGFTSCAGGFSTATHLHIARRYNGEWIPADCNRCPAGVTVPPFVMSNWKVVGLSSQLYQGFLVSTLDNRSVIAEQGRYTDVNAISW